MKKGFIFSLSTLYYVLLFLVFLSVFMVAYFNFSYKDKAEYLIYLKRYSSFADSGIGIPTSNYYWCAVYYFYDSNQNLNYQTTPQQKRFCEGYDKERLF